MTTKNIFLDIEGWEEFSAEMWAACGINSGVHLARKIETNEFYWEGKVSPDLASKLNETTYRHNKKNDLV